MEHVGLLFVSKVNFNLQLVSVHSERLNILGLFERCAAAKPLGQLLKRGMLHHD